MLFNVVYNVCSTMALYSLDNLDAHSDTNCMVHIYVRCHSSRYYNIHGCTTPAIIITNKY